MIIGYSFRDDHINRNLIEAARGGAKLFIIDPRGIDAMKQDIFSTTQQAYELLRPHVIGASRRPLNDMFGGGSAVEFSKLEQFFRYSLLHRKPRA